jgi:subtilisin family serine protease
VFLNAAAAVPAIFSVFHRERFKTKNRWTRGIIQSRSKDTSFWNSNITGRDQVVAIGDTGVDTGLGFFHDELNPVPYCTDSPSCNSVRPHRRFKAYIELSGGDRRDDDGHGSHTTASIAGKAHCIGMYSGEQSDQQLYNGMAPDAKIIFSDISNDETLGGLPENLDTDYFPLPFNLGARIRSDSWGTSDAFYTDSSRDFDSFAFHHDEFLPLIAAGNDGDTGLFSVGAPATAKNCIAVGATGNAEDSFSFLPDHDFGIRVDTSAATSCDASPPFPLISAHPAGFGPAFPAELRDWHIAISSPLDACSTLHGTDFSGKIVLIVRGTCTFVEKVRAAANAGAAGALIYNNEDGLIRMGGSGDDIKIPSASIIRQAGSQLSVSCSFPCCLQFS